METPRLNLVAARKRKSPAVGDSDEGISNDLNPAYWKKFKPFIQGTLPAASRVNAVAISPVEKAEQWAVGGGMRIEFLSARDKQSVSVFSRVKDLVHSVQYRSDGRLVAATDDTGLVQVIDVESRQTLRRYRGHSGPVHCCAFSVNKLHLLSGGDDASLKLWDLGTPKLPILDIPEAHGDYIRCVTAATAPDSPHLWLSGSHDGTAKLWDTSKVTVDSELTQNGDAESSSSQSDVAAGCIATLKHQSPVQAVRFFRSSARVATAGGHFVKIWDTKESPPRLTNKLKCHLKSITDMAISGDELMVITSSMDQTVKFHGVDDCTLRYSFNFNAPVTCVAIAPNRYNFACGLNNGQFIFRRNRAEEIADQHAEARQSGAKRLYKPGQFWGRGANAQPSKSDLVVIEDEVSHTKTKLDRLLSSFQYQESLDHAVSVSEHRGVSAVHGLIEELIQRGALEVACRGRDENSIMPILTFIQTHVGRDDSSTKRLVELTDALIYENDWLFSCSDERPKEMLRRISSKLTLELSAIGTFRELIGMMESIRSLPREETL